MSDAREPRYTAILSNSVFKNQMPAIDTYCDPIAKQRDYTVTRPN